MFSSHSESITRSIGNSDWSSEIGSFLLELSINDRLKNWRNWSIGSATICIIRKGKEKIKPDCYSSILLLFIFKIQLIKIQK